MSWQTGTLSPGGEYEVEQGGLCCGGQHSVVCWGQDHSRYLDPPSGAYGFVADGGHSGCVLDDSGQASCWSGVNADVLEGQQVYIAVSEGVLYGIDVDALFSGRTQNVTVTPGTVRRVIEAAREQGWPSRESETLHFERADLTFASAVTAFDPDDAEVRAACEQWFVPYPPPGR